MTKQVYKFCSAVSRFFACILITVTVNAHDLSGTDLDAETATPPAQPVIGAIGAAAKDATLLTADKMKWVDFPAYQGVQVIVIEGDMSKPGPFIARFKFPANIDLVPHFHPHPMVERETIISGALYVGFGEEFDNTKGVALTAGAVGIIPSDTPHYAWTREETVIQVHGIGPWKRIPIEN